MSIRKEHRKKGAVYVVNVWDPSRPSNRLVRTFPREKDARAFEAMHTLAKRRGDIESLDAGKETLLDFEKEWWANYAERHLAAATRKNYRFLLDRYILPELGRHQLRRINPRLIATFATGISSGAATQRKVLAVLQGILERAVEWQRIPTNPVRAVKKPEYRRARIIKPLDPHAVEAIRDLLYDRDRTLVSVLAYAGLRPGEALALRWEDVGERVLNVDKALALGEEKGTKNHRTRQVRLLSPLRSDLVEWRLASGSQGKGLVFPMTDGRPWTESKYRNWRRKVFRAAAPGVHPYDLRHSFASLLFAERRNPADIAEQMGHTIQTLLSTYVHVIEELNDRQNVEPEGLIREARWGRRAVAEGTS